MLRLSPARCSCVSQMHSPLCCDLLLRHRPDRYRHLNLNRIYLLRCSLRRCAVVTIASSCTIVAAAPSPAAARHCHCLVARACHGLVAIYMWFCGTLRIRSGCLRVRDAMFSHALRAPAAGTLIARLLRQTEGSHRCARVDVRGACAANRRCERRS